MIRTGNYTNYKGFDFRIVVEEEIWGLAYDGVNPPLKDFKKIVEGVFYLKIKRNDITNAFYVNTFCIFKKHQFHVDAIVSDVVRLVTDDRGAFEALNLEFRDRGEYILEVNKNELEKVWEIKRRSDYEFPFPQHLKEYEEIEL